jgi:hypothetical protein
MPKETLTARVSKHDREIAAIRGLIRTGMKLIVRVEAAQHKTEQTLERFIKSLERGERNGNGHKKGRVQ